MAKDNFEKAVTDAVSVFSHQIVEAVKNATLQELADIQNGELATDSRKALKTRVASKRSIAPLKKKRNFPKCAFSGCEKNRFPRGKGFCGEHWKQYNAGEIKTAGEYR